MNQAIEKHQQIIDLFSDCQSAEDTYTRIIEMGRKQKPLLDNEKVDSNLVSGCQSQLYLVSEINEGKVSFKAYADAFISAGLAQILVLFYSGMTPEEVLTVPPAFLEELKIPGSLTPSRANGLYSIHLRMKQEALKGLS